MDDVGHVLIKSSKMLKVREEQHEQNGVSSGRMTLTRLGTRDRAHDTQFIELIRERTLRRVAMVGVKNQNAERRRYNTATGPTQAAYIGPVSRIDQDSHRNSLSRATPLTRRAGG